MSYQDNDNCAQFILVFIVLVFIASFLVVPSVLVSHFVITIYEYHEVF